MSSLSIQGNVQSIQIQFQKQAPETQKTPSEARPPHRELRPERPAPSAQEQQQGISADRSEAAMMMKRFAKLDINGDGLADAEELAQRQKEKGGNAESAEKILKHFDSDGDGKISQAENNARIEHSRAKEAGEIQGPQ